MEAARSRVRERDRDGGGGGEAPAARSRVRERNRDGGGGGEAPTAKKLKALASLCLLFKKKSGEELAQIVPQWAFEYKRLVLDYNREVRWGTHDAMTSLVTTVGKDLVPHLTSLMGPWWFAQFDPIIEVSQAAKRSLEAAFPTSERRLDALMLCITDIFLYLDENLKLAPQALSDKATPMVELEDMHQRENTSTATNQVNTQAGPGASVTVEKDLVSQAEKRTWRLFLARMYFHHSFRMLRSILIHSKIWYVMGIGEAEAFSERLKRELLALETDNVHALLENEPFVEEIESRNNKLELQSVSNKVLIEEVDRLLEKLNFPPEFAACLTGGSLDEVRGVKCIEACEWLTGALRGLGDVDICYERMRAIQGQGQRLSHQHKTAITSRG